mmetsp:Transcript_86519/g.224698  ORF Transcript_86519/g.224698 Transcript_86519/m.224698 type:complete len:193 (-) Transcript_86519:79-657(-)
MHRPPAAGSGSDGGIGEGAAARAVTSPQHGEGGFAATTPVAARGGKAGDGDDEGIVSLYRELEHLELALLQERQRINTLMEEKAADKEAFTRDIAALESMLSHACAERDRLASENAALCAELARLQVGDKDQIRSEAKWKDASGCLSTPRSSIAPSEVCSRVSIEEPEIERSGELDTSASRMSPRRMQSPFH